MPKNWKTYKLGDISTDVSYGYTESASKEEIGPKFLRITDIQDDFIDWKTVPYCKISEKDLAKNKLEIGDIVIARTGNSTGATMCVRKEINAVFASYLIRFRLDKSIVFPAYVDFVLRSRIWKNYVDAIKGGSAQPGANAKQFGAFELNLPPLSEQKAIASILSAIDDKIENNLAINKTLEDMAMALYKHWFVDFGPFQDGEFIDSELGPIPKDWEVKRLEDFCTLTMGQSPKSEFYNNTKEGLPFHQGVKDYGKRFPSDETYSTEGKRLAEKGDVLFSVRAPVGRLNICKNKIILGRGLASIRMNDFNHFGFLFYALNTRFTEDDIIGDGTVYKSVNKSDLQNLKFLIPPNPLINDFNHNVIPNDEKYLNNFKENKTLTKLRDALLPKLISGEVRLKEFQNQIETVL
jgi:type I restriction enzyme S subunit